MPAFPSLSGRPTLATPEPGRTSSSSPLPRARQTADLFVAGVGLKRDPIDDDRLRPEPTGPTWRARWPITATLGGSCS